MSWDLSISEIKFSHIPLLEQFHATTSLSPQSERHISLILDYCNSLKNNKNIIRYICLTEQPKDIKIHFDIKDFIDNPNLNLSSRHICPCTQHILHITDEDYHYIVDNSEIIERIHPLLDEQKINKLLKTIETIDSDKIKEVFINLSKKMNSSNGYSLMVFTKNLIRQINSYETLKKIIENDRDILIKLSEEGLFFSNEQKKLLVEYLVNTFLSDNQNYYNNANTFSSVLDILLSDELDEIKIETTYSVEQTDKFTKNILKNIKNIRSNPYVTKTKLMRKVFALVTRLITDGILKIAESSWTFKKILKAIEDNAISIESFNKIICRVPALYKHISYQKKIDLYPKTVLHCSKTLEYDEFGIKILKIINSPILKVTTLDNRIENLDYRLNEPVIVDIINSLEETDTKIIQSLIRIIDTPKSVLSINAEDLNALESYYNWRRK